MYVANDNDILFSYVALLYVKSQLTRMIKN